MPSVLKVIPSDTYGVRLNKRREVEMERTLWGDSLGEEGVGRWDGRWS